MDTVIKTKITNCRPVARFVNWTADGAMWLDVGATVEVPYDVWSKANRKQREGILADCHNKAIKLTLCVLEEFGNYIEIGYDPSVLLKPVAPASSEVTARTKSITRQPETNEETHTVVATGGASARAAACFGATRTPVTEKDNSTETYRQMDGVGFQKVQEQEPEPAKEPEEPKQEPKQTEEPTAAAEEEPTTVDLQEAGYDKEAFDKAVAAKNWEEALAIIKAVFGEDKVIFGTRTIAAMKDWDAIVAKYKLAD